MADEERYPNSGIMERWNSMSRSRQVVVGILGVSVLVFVILMAQHLARPQYVPLYSNLDPSQAQPVVEKLQEQGVPYRLENFGSTIKVPHERMDELRIELAGEGMPLAQGTGFELFDEERLGMTDFERRVKLQRALQEELRRTISALDAVSQARVHLVLPEPRVFLEERGDPSAAVYLALNPLHDLKEGQVKGIVNMVASSVEGLQQDAVSVIDSKGNLLYDPMETEDFASAQAGSAFRQLEVQRDFEKELEGKVQRVLERVFGHGKAMAIVSAEMDFDARETTVITYDNEGIPRSQQIIEESHEGEGPPMEEVGDANYPGYAGVVPGGDSSYERREEITNYEVGEVTEHHLSAPGRIERLNTSVVVDTGGNPITAEEIEQVNQLVASAIGLDEERGDLVSVQGMNFDTTAQDEIEAAMAEAAAQEQQQQMFRQAVLGAAALVTVVLVVLALRRRKKLQEERDDLYLAGKTPLEDLLAMEEEEEDTYMPSAPQEKTSSSQAKKLLEQNPEVAASILRSWMVEE